jgi:hypothetical protein
MTADGQGNAYGAGETSVKNADGNYNSVCVVTKYDPSGKLLWSRQARYTRGASSFYAVAADRFGNVFAAGTMWGAGVDFGNGVKLAEPAEPPSPETPTSRLFLVKYDAKGQAQWVQTGPAREHTTVESLAADSEGNVYLVGYISSGVMDPSGPLVFLKQPSKLRFIPESEGDGGGYFLAKLDAKGTPLWAAMPRGGWVNLLAAVVDGSGNVYVAGQASGDTTTSFGNGVLLAGGPVTGRPLLVKYGPDGTAQWVRGAAKPGGDCRLDFLAVDAVGNLYAAGTLSEAVTCGFGNGVSVTGSSPINPVLVKYDATGKVQWARTTVGGSIMWYMRGVAADAAGAYLALQVMRGDAKEQCDLGNGVGFTGGYSIVGYAPSGEPLWAAKTPGDMGSNWGLRADGNGHVYVLADAAYGPASDFGNGIVLKDAKSYIAKYGTGVQGLAACIDTRVRVRSAAKLDAGTLGYLEKGDRLEVLERSAEAMKVDTMNDYWYRVRRVTDGLTGWSYGAFLKLDQ